MTKSGKRMAMIAALSAALVAGNAQLRPAQADRGAATPFGPALLGATLAVFGLGGVASRPEAAASAPGRAGAARDTSEVAELVPPAPPRSARQATARPVR